MPESELSHVRVPGGPKSWKAAEKRAARELERSSRILDSTSFSGLASDNTLKKRGYISGPQGGLFVEPHKLPPLPPLSVTHQENASTDIEITDLDSEK